jgi:hypothetical protein
LSEAGFEGQRSDDSRPLEPVSAMAVLDGLSEMLSEK